MNTDLQAVAAFVTRVKQRIEPLNQTLARQEGACETVATALKEAEIRVGNTGDDVEILSAVLDLLQGMEGAFQRNFQRSLAAIVSEGLSQVFGEKLEVRIEASTRADMSAVRFRLIKGDGHEEDIMTGQGGGVVQVIAFLLRVLLILAARPLLRRLLVLDEPFAMVSPEFRPGLGEMVQALVERLDFQLIMVTQEREFASYADHAYFFEMRNAVTTLRDFGNDNKGAPEEVTAS